MAWVGRTGASPKSFSPLLYDILTVGGGDLVLGGGWIAEKDPHDSMQSCRCVGKVMKARELVTGGSGRGVASGASTMNFLEFRTSVVGGVVLWVGAARAELGKPHIKLPHVFMSALGIGV